jgi:toxin ParE1/3/4
MGQLIVRELAWDEAKDIGNRISKDNLEVALRVYARIREAFEFVATHPGAGAKCEVVNPRLIGLRYWPVTNYRNYLVLYRPLDDGAEILRVIHGAQDLARLVPDR